MHRHVRTPCAMLQFSMYRYLPATRVAVTHLGASSGSPSGRFSSTLHGFDFPIPDEIAHPRVALSAILSPRSRKSHRFRSRRNSHCISVFDYTTQRSRAPKARKRGPGATDYKILLYATPKSTIKPISSFMTCIISSSLKARGYL